MADKLPFFKFYPGDWTKNFALRTVSYAARGLLVDILCFMHESSRRGHLEINGKPASTAQLCQALGIDQKQLTAWLKELIDAEVLSKNRDGTIFSEQMVQEEAYRLKARKFGKKGGNKALMQNQTAIPAAPERKSSRTKAEARTDGKNKIQWDGRMWFPSELQKQAKLLDTQIEEYRRKMRNSDRTADGGNSHNVCYI